MLTLLSSSPAPVFGQGEDQTEPVNIHFFWMEGCKYCESQKQFLEKLIQKHGSNVKIISYEAFTVENYPLFEEYGRMLGFDPIGVPVTIISDQYWIGSNGENQAEIELAVQERLEIQSEINPDTGTKDKQKSEHIIDVPLIGPIDLDQQSLLISSAIIGFVDGFNPCSLWVLSILLAITLHSGSRSKTLIVGLTFLITTTIIYSLFIAGVFTIFSYVGYLKWIQVLIGLLALVFGLVNLKDYFWYKEGVSFTISDKHKPKLYENMRSTVTTPRSMISLILSTAALAVGVSLIEFACTAGFPVIWSNLMISNNVTTMTFIALLGVYMLIYLIDELFVFGTAVVTMKASKIEEKHGRILKLISGSVILTLSVVMLVNPDLMNQFGTSLIVFAVSLAGAALIYIVHQHILPKFSIFIGSGFTKPKGKKKLH